MEKSCTRCYDFVARGICLSSAPARSSEDYLQGLHWGVRLYNTQCSFSSLKTVVLTGDVSSAQRLGLFSRGSVLK